jgi:hypothetical protein
MYPVEIAYLQEPTPDYVRKGAEVVWNINLQVSDEFRSGRVAKIQHLFVARARRHPFISNRSGRYRAVSRRIIGDAPNVRRSNFYCMIALHGV